MTKTYKLLIPLPVANNFDAEHGLRLSTGFFHEAEITVGQAAYSATYWKVQKMCS